MFRETLVVYTVGDGFKATIAEAQVKDKRARIRKMVVEIPANSLTVFQK